MPRYDYRCRACDERFEVRRGMDEPETDVVCPQGHPDTTRVFTAVAVGGASAAPVRAGGGGGGCCGGGCCG
jgi:putative FmdB family regulatory protein